MKFLVVALIPLASVAATVRLLLPRVSTARTSVLDRRAADFREDEDSARVVASLEATLVRADGRTRLEIRACAVGPRVDAARGVRGVRGGNAIAAEEIAAIVAGGRAEVRVNGRAVGTLAVGRSGEVLERRLGEDGDVEHVAARGAGPLEVVFAAPLDRRDEVADVEVVVDGRVRVRARVRDRGMRLVLLEGVAAHGRGAKP